MSAATHLGISVAAALAIAPGAAEAHGFGQRYDLPLPLSFYLVGTAGAVVLTFVVVALFARHRPAGSAYPRLELPLGRSVITAVAAVLRIGAVALLGLTVAAGFLGAQDPYRNIAPTLVWIVGWVGLAMVSALVGDVWGVANPWRASFDAADRLYRAATGRSGLSLRRRYPEWLGVWPAVILLFLVSWTELVFPSPAVPGNIAWLVLFYSLLAWAGMALFGSREWTGCGEVFAVFFGLLARFAPTEATSGRGVALRPFAAGLLGNEPASPSLVAFVLLVLASVLYDGLLTTPEWTGLEAALAAPLPGTRAANLMAVRTAGLLLFWGLFLGAYLAVSWAMSRIAGAGGMGMIAREFAPTLVPIAIAYHLAHYLVYLLTQGQYVIPLVSDPFGRGWDLFGTAGYRVDIAIVGPRFAWYAAVAAIVAGHVVAVYLADRRARRLFANPGGALRAQVPLTALMVVYTFVSLSILAEPIVERRAPAMPSAVAETVAIPADAVLPEAGTGLLRAVGPGLKARTKLTYRVLGSAFHDATRMTPADILYAYMFAYRWADADPAIDAATADLRRRLAAVRLAGSDTSSRSFRVGEIEVTRELFIVEVYGDLPQGDPEQSAALAPPWSALPWHVIVLMEEAVANGWAAFSREEGLRRGVEWLDPVRSESLKLRLAALVERFAAEGFRPESLAALVGVEQARQRWAALAAFYRSHGHFLAANGPYRLKGWSAESATVEAFRDLSYPLGVGSYDAYAVPRRGFVTGWERVDGGMRLSADIEIVAKFMRDYRIERQKLRALDAAAAQRSAPECRYAVLGSDGRIALAGTAPPLPDRSFRIDLDSRLPPGRYTLLAEIVVNGNALNAAIERITFEIRE